MMIYCLQRIQNIVCVIEWWSFDSFLQAASLVCFQQERVMFPRKKKKKKTNSSLESRSFHLQRPSVTVTGWKDTNMK